MTCGLSCPRACGVLVPQPGIEPTFPALEGGFLTTGPPGESLELVLVLGYRLSYCTKKTPKKLWLKKDCFLSQITVLGEVAGGGSAPPVISEPRCPLSYSFTVLGSWAQPGLRCI